VVTTNASSRRVAAILRGLKESGFSLRALAIGAGVDQSLVSRIASGERTATPAVAEALASALEAVAARSTKAAKAIRAIRQSGGPARRGNV
jgi:transcriptional regulator with XRE-family HTH domain